jgi:hypothetical protein
MRSRSLVCRCEPGWLEGASRHDVQHAAGNRHSLGVSLVQVHAVPLDRVAPDGQGVGAGQHRARGEVERVGDVPSQR